MSQRDIPVPNQADRIEEGIVALGARIDRQTAAINHVGENLQWIIDNVQGIFQMFGSPEFMRMMGPVAQSMARPEMEAVNGGPDGGPERAAERAAEGGD